MRVRVDPDLCQGHTLCNVAAPDVFELREDDGHAVVHDEHIAPELEAQVRRAALGCPERAIQIVEEP